MGVYSKRIKDTSIHMEDMDMKTRYSYFVQVTEKAHIGVSAKEFKELSKHWDASEEVNGITIYTVEGIECGRRCRKN